MGKQKQNLLKEQRYNNSRPFKKSKGNKKFRRQHLIDDNNPFDNLFYWSREVRIACDHKCVQCGKTRKLTSHHLFSKSKFPLLKYNISNGIVLCFNCHIELHQLNDVIALCVYNKNANN